MSGGYPGPARYPVEEYSPKPTKKPHKEEEPVHYTPGKVQLSKNKLEILCFKHLYKLDVSEKCLYCPEAYKSDKKVTNVK